jgi:hypothetical protein
MPIALEPAMTTFDSASRLNDPQDLLEICGIFAVYGESFRHNHDAHLVRLARHSVRHFFSEGLNSTSEFWLPKKASHRELAVLRLTYLLLEDWTHLFENTTEGKLCLKLIAITLSCTQHARGLPMFCDRRLRQNSYR